ncbi:MAG: PIN domain-containing protein [Alphaproteobacteria bacterium]|jgi:predicted nucleic acid-binding protein|nr:PIN domain-containing protein [Alphaproteobacteria bacterium]
MLEPLFVDTGYVIGLVNVKDANHARALALADRYDGYPLVTTDAVLLEVGNALSRIARVEAVEILHHFQASGDVTLVHLNPILFNRAVGLYEKYKDKHWGLVDCVSFLVMQEMRLTTALAFDQHFVQAGFQLPH